MTFPSIDVSQFQNGEENPYYKRIKKEIGNRMGKRCYLDIEDSVRLSTMAWDESVLGDGDDDFVNDSVADDSGGDSDSDHDVRQTRQKNTARFIHSLGYRIEFKDRIPQLKEMFRYNIIQSKSHNYYLSKFARFKVGVVGQILVWSGVSIVALKKMKKEALNEAFEENLDSVSENIYSMELAALVYGQSRKSKNTKRLLDQEQTQLIQQMENLGRSGYWSKTRVLEERITQITRIKDEFIKEKLDLEYELEHRVQGGDVLSLDKIHQQVKLLNEHINRIDHRLKGYNNQAQRLQGGGVSYSTRQQVEFGLKVFDLVSDTYESV
jgi:hypothetical protein